MTDRSDRRAPPLTPALLSVTLVGIVVVAGVAAGALTSDDEASSSGPTAAGFVSAAAPVVTTAAPTTGPIVKTHLSESLVDGSWGAEVEAVQTRLKELGFDPGPIDGQFGSLTQAAVWAFEKLVMQTPRSEATGRVTDEIWQLMQEPLVVMPRRPEAATVNHTEVYLPEQVVIFFHGDRAVLISHMSSGTGEDWCEEVTISPGERGNENGTEPLKRGECGNSTTPGGVFEYDRQRTGAWESALGTMWNPMYFNFGIAIHGAISVPLEPASHGCIRIPMYLGERFQSLVAMGDQVFVFDGLQEPESYSDEEKMPIFNRVDPNYSTTTSAPPVEIEEPQPDPEQEPEPAPEPESQPEPEQISDDGQDSEDEQQQEQDAEPAPTEPAPVVTEAAAPPTVTSVPADH